MSHLPSVYQQLQYANTKCTCLHFAAKLLLTLCVIYAYITLCLHSMCTCMSHVKDNFPSLKENDVFLVPIVNSKNKFYKHKLHQTSRISSCSSVNVIAYFYIQSLVYRGTLRPTQTPNSEQLDRLRNRRVRQSVQSSLWDSKSSGWQKLIFSK